MDEKQAILFWNAICRGEIIGHTQETNYSQGFPIEKPTYTSTICTHLGIPTLTVPIMRYCIYDAKEQGVDRSNKQDTEKVVKFLREIANVIEEGSKEIVDNTPINPNIPRQKPPEWKDEPNF